MSQEVLEIVKGMGFKKLEIQIVMQCTPVIAGLKTSNLLIVPRTNLSKIEQILRESALSYFLLYKGEEKIILLLYDASELEKYLSDKKVSDLLESWGYQIDGKQKWIAILQERYGRYVEKKGDFPHEIGIFLGYPVEDVIGFIENSGQNSFYSGYWKVYSNVAATVQLFQKFDLAKESFIQFLASGMTILEIMNRRNAKREIASICAR